MAGATAGSAVAVPVDVRADVRADGPIVAAAGLVEEDASGLVVVASPVGAAAINGVNDGASAPVVRTIDPIRTTTLVTAAHPTERRTRDSPHKAPPRVPG